MFKKIHVAGLIPFLTQIALLIESPLFMDHLTKDQAFIAMIIVAVIQGVTKGIQQGNTELVDRGR